MPAAIIGGAIAGAASIGSAMIGSSAAKSAAKTSAAAADRSLAVQQEQFNQTTANNKPFLTTGTSALDRLAGLYGLDSVNSDGSVKPGSTPNLSGENSSFYQSPDYQFALDEGRKAIDASAAARGMIDSGATRKAQIKYAGNLASSNFNSYAGRLQELAGIGQAAANSQAAAGAGFANNYSNTLQNSATDQGNATLAGANSSMSALNNLAGIAGSTINQLGKNPFQSSYTGNAGAPPPPNMQPTYAGLINNYKNIPMGGYI